MKAYNFSTLFQTAVVTLLLIGIFFFLSYLFSQEVYEVTAASLVILIVYLCVVFFSLGILLPLANPHANLKWAFVACAFISSSLGLVVMIEFFGYTLFKVILLPVIVFFLVYAAFIASFFKRKAPIPIKTRVSKENLEGMHHGIEPPLVGEEQEQARPLAGTGPLVEEAPIEQQGLPVEETIPASNQEQPASSPSPEEPPEKEGIFPEVVSYLSSDKRGAQRYEEALSVTCKLEDRELEGVTVDISALGVQVSLYEPLKEGTEVEIFVFRSDVEEMHANALVSWCKEGGLHAGERTYRIGLKFLHIGASDKLRLLFRQFFK